MRYGNMGKHLLYAFSLCMAALLLAGCRGDDVAIPTTGGEMQVRLRVSMPDGIGTRSLVTGKEESINLIQLFCFDANGLFLTKRNAHSEKTSSDPDHGEIQIETTVPAATCRIHFVANHDLAIGTAHVGQAENSLVNSDAFTASKNDGIGYWGYHKEETVDEMKTFLKSNKTIYLVRDRAKVTIENASEESLTPVTSIKWIATNGLSKGYISPFNHSDLSSPFTDTKDNKNISTVVTPYAQAQRTAATAGDLEDATQAQYLFEDDNSIDNPVKLIIEATYGEGEDKVVKYHPLLLIDGKYNLYKITRNHHYIVKITSLPETAGYDSFEDALESKYYSNDQVAEISDVVNEITDGQYDLTVGDDEESSSGIFYHQNTDDEEHGTTVVCHESGSHTVGFTYTDMSGKGVSADKITAADFTATWTEALYGITSDFNASVAYDNATGKGSVAFNLADVTSTLKSGTITLTDTKYGLQRKIKVYSIDKFKYQAKPTLVKTETQDTIVGKPCNTYQLTFTLPDNYPAALYPINISIATSTLNPYKVNNVQTTFGVKMGDTSRIGESSSNVADWNYNLSGWGYWYTYQIKSPAESKKITILFDDVRGFRESSKIDNSTVGLYLSIPYFEGPISVSAK